MTEAREFSAEDYCLRLLSRGLALSREGVCSAFGSAASPSRFALATSTIQSLAPAASRIAALLAGEVTVCDG